MGGLLQRVRSSLPQCSAVIVFGSTGARHVDDLSAPAAPRSSPAVGLAFGLARGF